MAYGWIRAGRNTGVCVCVTVCLCAMVAAIFSMASSHQHSNVQRPEMHVKMAAAAGC